MQDQPIRLPRSKVDDESTAKLRDWDSVDSDYDSAKFKNHTGRFQTRKSTGEFIRKRFGTLDGVVSEADSVVGRGTVRSVSERIRARKRTISFFSNLFRRK